MKKLLILSLLGLSLQSCTKRRTVVFHASGGSGSYLFTYQNTDGGTVQQWTNDVSFKLKKSEYADVIVNNTGSQNFKLEALVDGVPAKTETGSLISMRYDW